MLDYLEIRKAHAAGESIRSIALRLGHCQKTVCRAIRSPTGEPLPYTRKRPVGFPRLGPFVGIIQQILRDDESAPRKQRHHASRIYERLKSEHGYAGSYYPVRRYVASLVQSNRETFMRLDHAPGRRMEFDFGQVQVDYPEGRRTTDVLSGVWTFSDCPFLIALPSQRIESILEGMSRAFEFFACVPREVWWDNPRAVAIEILRGRDRTLNPAYAALASHHRFDPLFCMPARGQEKSDAERSIFALERRACTPVPRANDLADLNRRLLAFCMAERDRVVIHQTKTIGENFELEMPHALPLPTHRFDACIKRAGLVDKYQTVIFETNRYSVPHGAAFSKVTVKAYVDQVAVVHKGQIVAEHRRGYGRHESFIDPLHFVAALARKPAWLDHVPAMRDWNLPESFERLRRTFREHHGPRTGDRHYIRVLQLLMRHPATRIDLVIGTQIHKPNLTAERRGLRQAVQVIALADGGNGIYPMLEREFRGYVRIIDWRHAQEHLYDCAKAATGPDSPGRVPLARKMETLLWNGRVKKVIALLSEYSQRVGAPMEQDGPDHPRRVLHQNVGYFTKHQEHMNYPEYRRRGWPIGSGVVEAGVKQFNKRVKGTDQFWNEQGIEPILSLRALWLSQDERWQRYWASRPAYSRAA